MSTNPIKIPRDLEPGDVIVDNTGDHHVCHVGDIYHPHSVYYADGAIFTGANYWNKKGLCETDAHLYAVKIIRKTSKPAKPKRNRDAEWCRRMAKETHGDHIKIYRRIARKLEGMSK